MDRRVALVEPFTAKQLSRLVAFDHILRKAYEIKGHRLDGDNMIWGFYNESGKLTDKVFDMDGRLECILYETADAVWRSDFQENNSMRAGAQAIVDSIKSEWEEQYMSKDTFQQLWDQE